MSIYKEKFGSHLENSYCHVRSRLFWTIFCYLSGIASTAGLLLMWQRDDVNGILLFILFLIGFVSVSIYNTIIFVVTYTDSCTRYHD